MTDLINIATNAEGAQVVSGRELHGFLENGKDFSNWMKHRIEKYGLIENQDFTVFAQLGENSKGGRPSLEYALTLDAAKELAMVEGNDKGKQARQYFIQAEKERNTLRTQTALPATPVELILQMAQAMVSNERRVSDLESRLGRMEDIQAGATVELLQLPAPTEDLPDLSTADKIRRMVNVYASAKGKPAQDIWRELYSELYYRYKVMVNGIGLLKGESKLSALVRLGHVDKLFNVALHRLRAE